MSLIRKVKLAQKLLDGTLYKYQVRYLSSSARRKLNVKGRQMGYSTIIALEAAVDGFLIPNFVTLILSTREDKASDVLKEAKKYLRKIPGTEEFIVTDKATELGLSNGSRIISLPTQNVEAVRGFTGSRLVLDEFGSMASIVNTDELWGAALPTLSRGGSVVVQGTPKGKSNKFYELYKAGEFEVMETPYWMCPDLTEENLAPIRAELSRVPGLWEQEYECSWEGIGGASLWTLAELEALLTDSVDGQGTRIAGYDPAKKQDGSVFMIVEKKGNEKRVIFSVDLSGLRYIDQATKIKEYVNLFNVQKLYVDAWGVGESVLENLDYVGCKVIPTRLKGEDKSRIAVQIKGDAEKGHFKILNHKNSRNIIEDLSLFDIANPKFQYTKDGHSDFLSALMLAYSGINKGSGSIGNLGWSPRAYRPNSMKVNV